MFEGHTNGDGGAAPWQSSHLLLVCVLPWVRQKDVAQIVECLPSRYKALGTQPKYTQHRTVAHTFVIPVVRRGGRRISFNQVYRKFEAILRYMRPPVSN